MNDMKNMDKIEQNEVKKLIYQISPGRFLELNKKDKKMSFLFGFPLWTLVMSLLIISSIRHPVTIENIFSYIFLIGMTFLLIYIGGLSRAIKHKRLKIYNNGIIPSIIPFWDLTTKDVFIPYNKIVKIELDEHPKFKDLYEFEIHHKNGKIYKINSKWLYQYKIPTKDIKKTKEYLIKIKEEMEKKENDEKRKTGGRIILFQEYKNERYEKKG